MNNTSCSHNDGDLDAFGGTPEYVQRVRYIVLLFMVAISDLAGTDFGPKVPKLWPIGKGA